MNIKVVELFAGVGGFRIGLNRIEKYNNKTGKAIEKGSWDFVWANQWEPSTKSQPAFDCYVERFGSDHVSNDDISVVNKKEIPDHDLLVGGFPCQDYSVARSTSNEMGIKGKKGVLWWEIAEILRVKKPSHILLENVDRLLKSPAKQRGRDFAIMLKTLDQLGYIVQWRNINAGEYGMPQRRRRVFIFASQKKLKYSKSIIKSNKEDYLKHDGFFNDIFPIMVDDLKIETKNLSTYKDAVDITKNYKDKKFLNSGIYINGHVYNTDIKENYKGSIHTLGKVVKDATKYNKELKSYLIPSDKLEKWEYLKGNKRIPRIKPNGERYFYSEGQMAFPDSLEKPGRTMLTSESTINRSSHIIFDETFNDYRTITEVEAELLQMFPPNWTKTGMSTRQRYFMMGNALVTGVVSKLEKKLREIIIKK